MSAVDILRSARALIERQWCQGNDKASAANHAYGHCVVSALAYSDPWYQVARDALQTAIGADSWLHVVAWNDAPERTKEDVLAAYDRAISAAKEAA